MSSQSGTKQVWRIDADGKNLTKLTDVNTQVISAQILRNDSTVVYLTEIADGDAILFRQTPDGQSARLTESDTSYWSISRDEKFLAVEILDKNTRKFHIELRSLEDGKLIKIFDFQPKRQMSFTPDGKNLAYDTTQGDVSQIMLQPLDGGEPQALTDFQTEDIFSFDWSPDGSRLAVIRGKQLNDAVLIKDNNR